MDSTDENAWDLLTRSRFRVPGLRPFQKEVLKALLNPEKPRVLAVMPTGSGKTLCFTLPALLHPGPSLVIYPLKALVEDQERRFQGLGIPCGVLQGGQTKPQREKVFRDLREGKIRFLLANPEVLSVRAVRQAVIRTSWFQVILDEVHCVSAWGDTFRPAYLELEGLVRSLEYRTLAGFTATAGPDLIHRIQKVIFQERPAQVLIADPDRPNIHYAVWETASRRWALEDGLGRFPKPALVFCRTREAARMTAVFLARAHRDTPVRFYHAGLAKEEKTALQNWFYQSSDGILCSTKAFGLGVDKPDVRTVIHWDVPDTLEDFLQESGRAGRDGHPSWSLVLRGPDREGSRGRLMPLLEKRDRCLRKSLLVSLGGPDRDCGNCGPCLGTALPAGPAEGKQFSAGYQEARTRSQILWGRKTPDLAWWIPPLHPLWGKGRNSTLEALEQACLAQLPPEKEKKKTFRAFFSGGSWLKPLERDKLVP